MLDPEKGNIFSLEPDTELGPRERNILASFAMQEGFDIFQTLMEDAVRSFNRSLINTNPVDEKEVLARHNMAHTVGRFYVDFMSRLKQELGVAYAASQKLGTPQNPENPNNVEDFR